MITIDSDKFKCFLANNQNSTLSPILKIIKAYENYIACNDFKDLTCPCCETNGSLEYHKTYQRNLIYQHENTVIDVTINIGVVKCKNCTKLDKQQKYHALLPDFVLPYHIYEASTIINSLYNYLVQKIKLETILKKLCIRHKQFYDWLKKVKIYLLSSSILLEENINIITIIKKIYLYNRVFLNKFFLIYKHPYFLFKNTCVSLCINP